jgi:hypothetical protein
MRILTVAILLTGAAHTLAQDQAPSHEPAPRVVLTMRAEGRSAPPSGPLNLVVGHKVQTIPEGSEVTVLGRKTYGAFDGTHVWLEVRPPVVAASAAPSSRVWIYGGVQTGNGVVPSRVIAGK